MSLKKIMRLGAAFRVYLTIRDKPDWKHLVKAFKYHRDGVLAMRRLTGDWVELFDLESVNIYHGVVVHEHWSASKIDKILERMQQKGIQLGMNATIRTDAPPRFIDGSLVVVRTQGKEFLIDGRRRANFWSKGSGRHGVWVVKVEPQPMSKQGVLQTLLM